VGKRFLPPISVLLLFAAPLAAQVVLDAEQEPPRRLAGAGPAPEQAAPPAAGRSFADPAAIRDLDRLRRSGSPDLTAEFSPGDARPRAVYGLRAAAGDSTTRLPRGTGGLQPRGGGPTPSAGSSPANASDSHAAAREKAAAFLADYPGLVGAEEVVPESVHSSPILTVVRFEQRHGGIPVLGGYAVVQIDAAGEVAAYFSSLVRGLQDPAAPRAQPAESLDGARALEAAWRKLGDERGGPAHSARLAWARFGGRDRLIWDFRLRSGGRSWRVFVDAWTGEILGVGNLLRTIECPGGKLPRGTAYEFSPALGPAGLRELQDLDCRATNLAGVFIRSHHWLGEDPLTFEPLFGFQVQGRQPNGRDGGTIFDSTDSQSIAQVNVYYHATRFHEFVKGLGFDGLDRPFPAIANMATCYGYDPCENAFFDPLFPYSTGFGAILFGTGPIINFGLDGDVVYHEYTHGVVENTSNLGDDFSHPDVHFSDALNEAFADYFSGTFSGDPRLSEYGGPVVGAPEIRNLDNNRRYPDGIDAFDPHETGLIWGGAAWEIRQAFSRGGTVQAGVERADRLLYACLISLPSTSDLLRAAGILIATSSTADYTVVEQTTVKDILARRGLTQQGGEAPPIFQDLASGTTAEGEVAAAGTVALRLAPVQYRVQVPQDGSRLTIGLEEAQQAGGKLDLYVRFNNPVVAPGGTVIATYASEDASSSEVVLIDVRSSPPLAPGTYFVAVGNRGASISSYRLTATLVTGQTTPVVPLDSGRPVDLVIAGGAIHPIQYSFEVTDPTIWRLVVGAEGDGDLELLLRHGLLVEAPQGGEGRVEADISARSQVGRPATEVGPVTVPILRRGTYHVAIRSRSPTSVACRLKAELLPAPAHPSIDVPLIPGILAGDAVEAAPVGVQVLDNTQFRIDVPQDGAVVTVTVKTPGDLGLLLRRSKRVGFEGKVLVFDHASSTPGPGDERLEIDLFSSPRLESGQYFLAIANRGNESAAYEVLLELGIAPPVGIVEDLTNGMWTSSVAGPAAIGQAGKLSDFQFRLAVGPGAVGFDAITSPKDPGDLDLFVRRGRPVQSINGNIVADFRAVTERGAEAITLFAGSVVPGDYYIAVSNHSQQAVGFEIVALAGVDPLSVPAQEGVIWEGDLSAAPNPPSSCTLGLFQFFIDVPAAASRIEFRVGTPNGGPLDILLREGSRILIDRGEALFDRRQSSDRGSLVLEGADLHSGLYFFALANCQGSDQLFRVTARTEIPGAPEFPLVDGVATKGLVAGAAPDAPVLHATQFTIEIDPGVVELTLALWTADCAHSDLDLLVSRDERVLLLPDGTDTASVRGLRRGAGAETIVLNGQSNPPLAPGKYFLAVANRQPQSAAFSVGAATTVAPSQTIPAGGSAAGTIEPSPQPGSGVLHPTEYRLDLFPGAETLQVDLSGAGDVDLFLRYGLPVSIDWSGRPLTDWASAAVNPAGNEKIALPLQGECIRPGSYFISIGSFAPNRVNFTVKNAVTGYEAILARLGDVVERVAPASPQGDLAPPPLQVAVDVPAGAPGFQADLVPEGDPASANLDLFIRQGKPVEFAAAVTADTSSQTASGLESLTIPQSRLVPGRYFVAVASRERRDVPYRLHLLPLAERLRELPLEQRDSGVAPAATATGLGWLASEQLRFRIPQAGASALWVNLITEDPASPLELHVRTGRRVEVDGKTVVADRSVTFAGGEKRLRLGFPPAGDYYIAVRNLRPRSEPFQIEAGTGARALRGDVDESKVLDISDAIATLERLFKGGDPICMAAADVDGTGIVDLTDPINLLLYLFVGGDPPAAPFPTCGGAGALTEGCRGVGCP